MEKKIMEKIQSFTINHLKLKSGLYLSRKDEYKKTVVSTFDIRIRIPNNEPVMDMPAIHTIEHLGATYLRNSEYKDRIVYFGPMGCRTGFYLVMFGDLSPKDIMGLVIDTLDFIINYNGEIPGATPIECGNYSEQDLETAKYYIKIYKERLIKDRFTEYPI